MESDKNIIRNRRIQRRGNIYTIQTKYNIGGEEWTNLQEVDNMMNDLYRETLHMSSSANRTANIFKCLYILSYFFIIVSGALIGVLTIEGHSNKISIYIAAILGFAITAIKTLAVTFSIEKRGILLKDISLKLKRISREVKVLESSDLKPNEKIKKLEEYYTEVDDLDLNIYNNNVTVSSTNAKSTNTKSTNAKSTNTKSTNAKSTNTKSTNAKSTNTKSMNNEGMNSEDSSWRLFRWKKKKKNKSGVLPVTMYDTKVDAKSTSIIKEMNNPINVRVE